MTTTATTIQAWAAQEAAKPVVPFSYDPGPLGAEEVEIRVEHCGLCHSDLSLIDNEWGMSSYPIVGGHGGCRYRRWSSAMRFRPD